VAADVIQRASHKHQTLDAVLLYEESIKRQRRCKKHD
jgi:hypothetical protein